MKPQNCNGESAPKEHRGLREPWKPGESGNPAGRPKGSRNKLGEEFITELYNDWCQHGAAALKKVRENRPDVYVKVVASLLPREIEAKVAKSWEEALDELRLLDEQLHRSRLADVSIFSTTERLHPLDGDKREFDLPSPFKVVAV